MSIGGIRPDAAALSGLREDSAELERARTTREAADKFETYLARMMVREMRKTVPEGLFAGPAMDMFSELFDEELAERISMGPGLGLSDALVAAMPGGELSPSRLGVPRPFGGAERVGRPGGPLLPFPGQRAGILPLIGRLSSGFGLRVDPLGEGKRHHKGLDIAAPSGSPIGAVEGGVVRAAGWRGGYGNAVVVEHADGTEALYGHCEQLKVQVGQRVQPGQTIATVGSTGRSTGPHLHFELRQNGEQVDPLRAYGWEHEEELHR